MFSCALCRKFLRVKSFYPESFGFLRLCTMEIITFRKRIFEGQDLQKLKSKLSGVLCPAIGAKSSGGLARTCLRWQLCQKEPRICINVRILEYLYLYSTVFVFCTAIGRRSRGQLQDDNSAKRNQLNAVVRSHQSTFSTIYSYYLSTNLFFSIVIISKSLDHGIRSLKLFRFLPVPAMHTAVGNCLTLECNSRTIQIFDFNFANNMSSARNVLVC